jgi:hypothetical protein
MILSVKKESKQEMIDDMSGLGLGIGHIGPVNGVIGY